MHGIYLLIFLVKSLFNFQTGTSPISKIDGEYIGGFKSVNTLSGLTYYKKNPAYTIIVNSSEELVDAISKAKRGDVIFLPSNRTYDLSSNRRIEIPKGVTLLSERGKGGSSGALVYTNNTSANPLFITKGDDIKISGIRFKGPDGQVTSVKVEKEIADVISGKKKSNLSVNRMRAYASPNASFLSVQHKNIEIENCEIYNWSYSGVFINNSAKAFIHHCYIHHNQRSGLGYGIYIDVGSAIIRGNVFDYNRHAIAGSGRTGTSYSATYNICRANSTNQGHAFDMHGGADRRDNTNIAGDSVVINNNVFYIKKGPAIKVRGVPLFPSKVSGNTFIIVGKKGSMVLSNMINQSGGKRGNLNSFKNKLL